jgi:hypothetical protein
MDQVELYKPPFHSSILTFQGILSSQVMIWVLPLAHISPPFGEVTMMKNPPEK